MTRPRLFDRVADLPVKITDWELTKQSRATSSDFTRVTTAVTVHGGDRTGCGEEVSYDAEAHEAWLAAEPSVPLVGEYSLSEASVELDQVDLFPARSPKRPVYRNYRRWAIESALLDLALRQAGEPLGEVLDREYGPLRFLVSTSLGSPPTADRVLEWLQIDPSLEFKLDATEDWTPELETVLANTGQVRILDCKALYDDPDVRTPPDADRYERLITTFPNVVLEDPGVTPDTRSLLAGTVDRLAWDVPITEPADLDRQPWQPQWINIKPSRFGSIRSLFECIERCLERGIGLYGGGQFELGIGRQQAQAIAALFYPDGPNDLAPRAYNMPSAQSGLPTSPLDPPVGSPGFGRPDA